MTPCACCGRNLGVGVDVLSVVFDRPGSDERCNRCYLGLCGCRLTPAQQQDADATIDRLAAEGARMERDARPWRDEDENTREFRNVL